MINIKHNNKGKQSKHKNNITTNSYNETTNKHKQANTNIHDRA